MELVEVEILTQAITSQYGTLAQGDILRTDPAFAKHLVEEARAAKYVKAPVEKKTEAIDPSTLTVPELKEALDAKGILYPSTALKADLVALLIPAA